jgi:hypothetical protein
LWMLAVMSKLYAVKILTSCVAIYGNLNVGAFLNVSLHLSSARHT